MNDRTKIHPSRPDSLRDAMIAADEPARVRIINMGRFAPIAEAGGTSAWYDVDGTVWFVKSHTQCHYCGERADWKMPEDAKPIIEKTWKIPDDFISVRWTHAPYRQLHPDAPIFSYLVMTEDFEEDGWKGAVLARTSDGVGEDVARLMAAAPDLLAACKALLPHVEGMIERANPAHDDTSAYSDQTAVRLARAAIATAEGKGGAA